MPYKTYLAPGGQQVHGVQYLYDASLLVRNTNDNSIIATGGFRPAFTSDFAANISVSGLNLSINAVAITGNPDVRVSNTSPIPFSGVVQANVTNTAPMAISGIVQTVVTGSVSTAVTSVAVTGGQIGTIDTGNRSVSVVNTAPLPISGVVQAAVSIGNVAVTGGQIQTITTGAITATIAPGTNIAVTGGSIQTIVTGSFSSSFAQGTNIGITGGFLNVADNSGNAFLASISGSLINLLADNVAVTGGSISISNTAPMPISGVVQAAVTIGNVAVTGGSINSVDTMGNVLLSGISGALTTNLNTAAWVTGQVQTITTGSITATIAPGTNIAVTGGSIQTIVTGTVSATVPSVLGVSGIKADTNSTIFGTPASTYAMLPIGGRAVAATGAGSITGGYNTGDYTMLSINKDNGGLMVNQGILDQTQDNVTVWAASSGSVSNDGVSGAVQTVLASNPNRRAWFIQNLHTGALMVRFSSSLPNTGSLNMILYGGSGVNDGRGEKFHNAPAYYTGPVSVSGVGGAPVLYTAWQI